MRMRNTGTSQGKRAKQTKESHGDPSHIQTTLPSSPSTPGRHADTRLSVDVARNLELAHPDRTAHSQDCLGTHMR